ncbi:pentatricopeptide repeat-containing protein [Carex littledalei]|uniref:Pentatricopeptide repeat-containing protein n=1 Tax=Carex littledalei TaxID=544730 RepID=A0A833RKC4_9POAL|nr:pentatricopeptide repeat-containing protein [Carex littledalei]
MALQPLNAYSSLRSLPLYSSSYTHPNPISLSPFSFVTRPQPHRTLLISCSSPAFSPIFLSHLESHQSEIEPRKPNQIDPKIEREPDPDPLINFLNDRVSGCNLFQDQLEELNDTRETRFEGNRQDPESGSSKSSKIEKILEIARNLPNSVTLGEQLGGFVGTVSEADCVSLLKKLSQEGLFKECLYLFKWMRIQDPVLVTPILFSVLFPVLGLACMSEEIMVLVRNFTQEKKFRHVCVYNSAISGLAKCGRYDYAWQVYEMLESNNIQPDHITCSILITILQKTRGKTAKDAWDLFQSMTRRGAKWSLESVSTLIRSFCQEGLMKEALIIQSEMEKRGISSNTFIYNTLMDTYVKSNEVAKAEGLFQEMKERGIKPSIVSYNILMDAYSKRMQPEVVESLISELLNFGLVPDVNSYTSLISSYGRKKDSEMANDAFLRMKKEGIHPNTHAYTALVHAYSISGGHEKALITYQNMVGEGVKPSIETFSALLNAFRRAEDAHKVMEIWKYMMENKVEGTRVTYNIILDCLGKNGLYVQARDVIFEFSKLGMDPTTMTYNMLINAYARGGQHYKIPMLLKEMTTLQLKPDSITYLTIVYAYIRVHDFTKAFYYHKEMVRKGLVPPDMKSYAKLRVSLQNMKKTKNMRDRSAILGIVNSKFGIKRRGKKDEFWKNKKRRTRIAKLTGDSRRYV